MEEANRHLLALEQLVGEGLMPQPYFRPLLTFSRATMLLAGGRLEEAEVASRAALDMGQATGQLDAPVFFAIQLFGIRFEQGRLDEEQVALVTATAERLPGVALFPATLALVD